jgi:hypothetical protein
MSDAIVNAIGVKMHANRPALPMVNVINGKKSRSDIPRCSVRRARSRVHKFDGRRGRRKEDTRLEKAWCNKKSQISGPRWLLYSCNSKLRGAEVTASNWGQCGAAPAVTLIGKPHRA